MSNINATVTENNIIGIVEQPVNIIGSISNTNIEVTIESQKEIQILGQIASETKIEAIVMNGVKGDSFKYEDFTPEQLESLKVNSVNDLIVYVDNKYLLPTIGITKYIYITKDEYMMYLWDNTNFIYQPLGLSSIEIKTIVGGNATTDFEKE